MLISLGFLFSDSGAEILVPGVIWRGPRYQWRCAAREPGSASGAHRRHRARREAADHGKMPLPSTRNFVYFICLTIFPGALWATLVVHFDHAAHKLLKFDVFA